ncbi:hypothetical protein F4804DRAFT_318013 [Jackrogersella minutella]|nr:hypothetical protein F4804DRAFT_318013 [Jackrogersella minutella]
MASQDQSFSSNNPFRRKLATPTISTENPAADPVASLDGHFDSIARPPSTTFKTAMPNDERKDEDKKVEDVAPVQPKPKKIVKRVRVQSPPPSSPEDSVPVARFPYASDDDDDDEGDDGDNSDSSNSQEYDEHVSRFKMASFPARDRDGSKYTQPRAPPNPFSKTLQDLEQTGQGQDTHALAAGAAAKGALDVNSFKRLLLTGYANIPGPSSTSGSGAGGNPALSTHSQAPLHDGASNTDASSISRQSIFDAILQDTPRTSHETSEPEDPEERRGVLPTSPLAPAPSSSSARKKPPPPSSRHGKLIKIELGADADSRIAKSSTSPISISTTSLPSIAPPRKSNSYPIAPLQQPPSATDVNKPLPLTPFRPTMEEAVDSPFDREAVGKVPEPFADLQSNLRPQTPPVATRNRSGSNGSTQARKPAAPPPRRHGRSDSRAPSIHATNTDDETPPRSSLDSNRSRTDSLRANANSSSSVNVPAPPPPRRPNHARQGSSYTSPSQASFTSLPGIGPGSGELQRSPTGTGLGLVSNSRQTEGQASLATVTTTKDGLHKLSPPPPPPTRQASTRRPASVRSMDGGNGFSMTRRVSKEKEGAAAPPPPPPRQRGSSRASVETLAPNAEVARNPSGEVRKEPSSPSRTSTGAADETKQGAEILADLDTLQREVDALMGRYGKAGGS